VAATPEGLVYVTGGVRMETDAGAGALLYKQGIVMACYTGDGAHQWSKMVGHDKVMGWEGAAVAVDKGGNAYFSGQAGAGVDTPVDFGGGNLEGNGADAFLASYAPDGAHRWSRRLNGMVAQLATAAAVDAMDRVYITGFSNGSVQLESEHSVETNGKFDMFLVQALQ